MASTLGRGLWQLAEPAPDSADSAALISARHAGLPPVFSLQVVLQGGPATQVREGLPREAGRARGGGGEVRACPLPAAGPACGAAGAAAAIVDRPLTAATAAAAAAGAAGLPQRGFRAPG